MRFEFLRREVTRAHNRPARPQGTGGQGDQNQDPRPERRAPAAGRVHARLHHDPEEAELGAAQGGPCPPLLWRRDHGLHPRCRPQPPGALHRPRARRPGEGPARRPLQGRARGARHLGRARAQPGPQPLRREEGVLGMPRNGPATRRELAPDPVYRSVLVTQVVNKILSRGKRTLAERIVYTALEQVQEKSGGDPVAALKRAVENTRPEVEVKSRRVGGAPYQVPVEVRPRRATTLAIRWLTTYSRQRREKTMAERLAGEILDASNNIGASVKRREDMHKMAESNRAFAHYRW